MKRLQPPTKQRISQVKWVLATIALRPWFWVIALGVVVFLLVFADAPGSVRTQRVTPQVLHDGRTFVNLDGVESLSASWPLEVQLRHLLPRKPVSVDLAVAGPEVARFADLARRGAFEAIDGSGVQTTPALLAAFAEAKGLRRLRLGPPADRFRPEALPPMATLELLDLNDWHGREVLPAAGSGHPMLHTLVSPLHRLSPEVLAMATALPSLRELHLDVPRRFENSEQIVASAKVLAAAPTLERLHLSGAADFKSVQTEVEAVVPGVRVLRGEGFTFLWFSLVMLGGGFAFLGLLSMFALAWFSSREAALTPGFRGPHLLVARSLAALSLPVGAIAGWALFGHPAFVAAWLAWVNAGIWFLTARSARRSSLSGASAVGLAGLALSFAPVFASAFPGGRPWVDGLIRGDHPAVTLGCLSLAGLTWWRTERRLATAARDRVEAGGFPLLDQNSAKEDALAARRSTEGEAEKPVWQPLPARNASVPASMLLAGHVAGWLQGEQQAAVSTPVVLLPCVMAICMLAMLITLHWTQQFERLRVLAPLPRSRGEHLQGFLNGFLRDSLRWSPVALLVPIGLGLLSDESQTFLLASFGWAVGLFAISFFAGLVFLPIRNPLARNVCMVGVAILLAQVSAAPLVSHMVLPDFPATWTMLLVPVVGCSLAFFAWRRAMRRLPEVEWGLR